jgi:hypothetical protein
VRKLAALLVALSLVATVAGCGGDDKPAAPAGDEAGRWAGPPRGSKDGTLAFDAFNKHLDGVSASWAGSPLLAAAEFLRLDSKQAGKTSVLAASRDEGATTRVTITLNRIEDDSVQAIRYVLDFERRDDGQVRLVGAQWSQKCARKRGHRSFTAADCV